MLNFEHMGELYPVALFIGILLFIELGRRWGKRDLAKGGMAKGIGPLEAGVFGLLGLLLAFTFSGAMGRWETRRALVVEETNDIGTAYLRLDLLQPADRTELQGLFKEYVQARLDMYQALPNVEAAKKDLDRAEALQGAIWTLAVEAGARDSSHVSTRLLLPALNEMIDITTTRTMALKAHPPVAIYFLLFVLSLAGSLIAGHGMAADSRRSWLHTLGYALIMSASVHVIIDLEFPRAGLIRIDAVDQALVHLLHSWP